MGASLRASSPIWASETSRAALRSRVLASLAQIGELARRLCGCEIKVLAAEPCSKNGSRDEAVTTAPPPKQVRFHLLFIFHLQLTNESVGSLR